MAGNVCLQAVLFFGVWVFDYIPLVYHDLSIQVVDL